MRHIGELARIAITGLYISEPFDGWYFIAERSPKGSRKLLWSAMPVLPTAADTRINAAEVPRYIRREAYRRLAMEGEQ